MKKVGIITIFRADNYGAELQAFALQKKLALMGFDSELIDYPFYKHPSFIRTPMSAPLFDIGFKNRMKERLFPYLQKVKDWSASKELIVRRQRMEEFHRRFTRLSAVTYHSMDELYAAQLSYDVFVAGSDQIWNPRMNSSLDPYFLTFAPPDKRRISYASSFGVSDLPDAVKAIYANRLAAFQNLAVRERAGVDIIRNLLDHPAEHVLDPTLLLDATEWSVVAMEPPVAPPYVLLYELMPCPGIATLGRRVAKTLEGSSLVRLNGEIAREESGVVTVRDAGPAEFVALFLNAAAVVTNSFHGTAFALNFNKPFFTVIPPRMKNAGRITSLLDVVGLADRAVPEGRVHTVSLASEVNFTVAQAKLATTRQASLDYLRRAIGDS